MTTVDETPARMGWGTLPPSGAASTRRSGGWEPESRPQPAPRRTPEIPWRKKNSTTRPEQPAPEQATPVAVPGPGLQPTSMWRRDDEAAAIEPNDATRVAPQRTLFWGAHGGAGSTTWAAILGGIEVPADQLARLVTRRTWSVVLVARASVVGIEAAKRILAENQGQISYVLLVPTGPGRPHKLIRNERKVLAGAITVVDAPWVPDLLLRLPEAVQPQHVPERDLARLRADIPSPEGEAQ